MGSSLSVFGCIAAVFCLARVKRLWFFPVFFSIGCCLAQDANLAPQFGRNCCLRTPAQVWNFR